MRKILVFILIFISFSDSTFAKWYGTKIVAKSGSVTRCTTDGQADATAPTSANIDDTTVNGIDIDLSLPAPVVLNTVPYYPDGQTRVATGNATYIYCNHWDSTSPTMIGPLNHLTGYTNTPFIVSFAGANDTGGSTLASAYLYESYSVDGGVSWISAGNVYTWPLSGNSVGLKTWIKPSPISGRMYYYTVYIVDQAGNTSPPYSSPGVIIFDNTPPSTYTLTVTGTNTILLAGSYHTLATNNASNETTFTINVPTGGGAPINLIEAKFENFINPVPSSSITLTPSTSGTLVFRPNIQNVDLDRGSNGGRQYTLTVTKVCDVAGNCTPTPNPPAQANKQVYVYANTTPLGLSQKNITLNDFSTQHIADGTTKKLEITLRDTYGNQVIPSSGISRTVDFRINTNNSLHLNQYVNNGPTGTDSAVFSDILAIGDIALGNSQSTDFINRPSLDGKYTLGFNVYAPTILGGGSLYSNGSFTINNTQFTIDGSIGQITVPQAVTGGSGIAFNFEPLYITSLTEGVRNDGFIEGTTQESKLTLTRNGTNPGTSSERLYVEYGTPMTGTRGGIPSTNFTLEHRILGVPNIFVGAISTSFPNTIFNNTFDNTIVPGGFTLGINTIRTKLTQILAQVTGNTKSYLSTHIRYTLGGKDIVYNGDIVGKDHYWGTPDTTTNTVQSGIEVLGTTTSTNNNEVITNQFDNDLKILGSVDKSSLKKDIVSSVYAAIKGVTPSNGTNTITDLVNFSSNVSGKKLQSDSILYFKLSGGNVTLSTSEISGKKTIIVVGGNFSITNNMYYSNPSQDILGIVVLKDDAGNGGNLYVDPSVTNIVGTIVLDKSLISYNGTELDGNADASILANQLNIFGNLYSENTIGGSRSTPLKCPFYRTCLTQEEAQKYDLNYTRRFSINSNGVPSNSGKLIGGATCTPNPSPADPTCIGGSSLYKGYYTTLPNTASEHPLIIEYNSLLGTVAPPLFSK